MFFGTKPAVTELHEFNDLLSDKIRITVESAADSTQIIPQGTRNSTMFNVAKSIVNQHGVNESAHEMFINESKKCLPLLSQKELDAIWKSVTTFSKKNVTNISATDNKSYKPDDNDFTELGQAKKFAEYYSNKVAYNNQMGFMYYNSKHWEPSEDKVRNLYTEFLDIQKVEAISSLKKIKSDLKSIGVKAEDIDKLADKVESITNIKKKNLLRQYNSATAFLKFTTHMRNRAPIANVLKLVEAKVIKNIEEFDTKEFLLNTP